MPLELDQSSYWDDLDNDGFIDLDETVYYDLTTQTGSQAQVNGALFFTVQPTGSAGTGLIQAFVRVQDGGNDDSPGFENGYNTSARPLVYEENTSPSFTKSLLLNQSPIVAIDGVQYYEFRLDINQLNSEPLLTLDAIKLFTSDVSDGELSGELGTAGFNVASLNEVYDLDGLQDSSLLLDYSLNAGSGKSDLFFYVPVADFGGVNPDETYVTLYSEFGETGTLGDDENLKAGDDSQFNSATYTNDETDDNPVTIEGDYFANDGFEEWSVSKQLTLFASGFKWEDSNGDGIWDPTENGLADWQMSYTYSVKVKGQDITVSGVVETADGVTDDLDGDGAIDDIGFYVIPLEFPNNNFTVTITETAPGVDLNTDFGDLDGWINTYAGGGTNDGVITYAYNKNTDPDDLPQGVSGTEGVLDFGNFDLFDISGTKFEDSNGDGMTAGDSGLAGWTIFIDADNDDVFDVGEKSAITDANGNWSITGLDASFDGLLVKEVLQNGWVQTLAPLSAIVGTSGNDQTGFDFANFENMNLSGYKWEDFDGESDWNGLDDGLSGWTIVIDNDEDPTNGVLFSDLTDADGKYEFTGLNPDSLTEVGGGDVLGNYSGDTLYVYEVTQTGWTQTFDGSYTFMLESGFTMNAPDGSAEEGNFGNFDLFDISGTKFEDSNGDGMTAGDSGLAGWTIFIDADNDDVFDVGEKSAITDANGNWSITGLDASFDGLLVKEVLQNGWVQTLAPLSAIVGTSGNDQTGFDFANFENMNLSGYKWEDFDGESDWNGLDDGLSGWTIVIDNDEDPTNGVLFSDLTDADGKYEFTGLNPDSLTEVGGGDVLGNYSGDTLYVYEVTQTGWTQTFDGSYTFMLESGFTMNAPDGSAEEGNFGNFDLFDISGTKFEDSNGDGMTAGDSGLAGWTIFIDADNDDVFDVGEKSAITDANGNWSITGLDASFDGLLVKEVLQNGWVQTLAPLSAIVGTSGNDQTGFDFANFENMNLSGYKWEDFDGESDWNGLDDGLSGWTIVIDNDEDPTNGVLFSDLTDADGKYEFTGLNPDSLTEVGGGDVLGNYSGDTLYVYEVTQTGWTQTFDGSYTFMLESGFTMNAPDGSAEEGNFGNFDLFDISGTKFEDSNGDGMTAGDSGLAGWTIFIDADNDDVFDVGEKSAITDANGNWSITGLDASFDGLLVKEVLQNGWVQTLAPLSAIVGTSGNDQTGFDFANFENMEISGYKWADLDGNSAWNEADSAVLSGWTIVLDQDNIANNGNEIATAITDANGFYEFTGLNPVDIALIGSDADGVLHVYEQQQDGFTQTFGGFSFDITSGLVIEGMLGVAEDGNFGNHMMAGANRTPGFWQSTLGQSLYNGDDDDNGDANGDGVPDGNKDFGAEGWSTTDLLSKYGIDTDMDGDNDSFWVWDGGDGTVDAGDVVLTVDELVSWVSGGPRGGGRDYLQILERDVGATFLNTLNNHSLTTPGDSTADPLTGMTALDSSIADSYEVAIDFILKYDGDFDGVASGNKKAQKGDWNNGGSAAHNELGAFNENGEAMMTGALTQILMDGDDYSSSYVQDYLAVEILNSTISSNIL